MFAVHIQYKFILQHIQGGFLTANGNFDAQKSEYGAQKRIIPRIHMIIHFLQKKTGPNCSIFASGAPFIFSLRL